MECARRPDERRRRGEQRCVAEVVGFGACPDGRAWDGPRPPSLLSLQTRDPLSEGGPMPTRDGGERLSRVRTYPADLAALSAALKTSQDDTAEARVRVELSMLPPPHGCLPNSGEL